MNYQSFRIKNLFNMISNFTIDKNQIANIFLSSSQNVELLNS